MNKEELTALPTLQGTSHCSCIEHCFLFMNTSVIMSVSGIPSQLGDQTVSRFLSHVSQRCGPIPHGACSFQPPGFSASLSVEITCQRKLAGWIQGPWPPTGAVALNLVTAKKKVSLHTCLGAHSSLSIYIIYNCKFIPVISSCFSFRFDSNFHIYNI